MVQPGTLWGSADGKRFRVISVTEIEGHTWVYYRDNRGWSVSEDQIREYSCYLESFLSRFTQMPE